MGVVNEYGKLRKVLLCEPCNFALHPINVIAAKFIEAGQEANLDRALKEHKEFVQALESLGVEVVWVPPEPRFPYQVFTRDIGVATKAGAIIGNFRENVRKGEEKVAEGVLKKHLRILQRIGEKLIGNFEGGDFIYIDENTVALGMGARTDREGIKLVQGIMGELGVEVTLVPFEPHYLHLDMIFSVVGCGLCVCCLEALPKEFRSFIVERGFRTIDVPPADVFELACNLLAVGDDIVVSPERNKVVNERLKALGFEVLEVYLEELLKGGGGPHCMTFPISRDSSS